MKTKIEFEFDANSYSEEFQTGVDDAQTDFFEAFDQEEDTHNKNAFIQNMILKGHLVAVEQPLQFYTPSGKPIY